MSKWAMFPFLWASVCVLWCIGGQFWKPARRYVLSVLMTAYAYFANREEKKRRFALVFLSLIGLLSMGYGEDSHLKRWCGGSETATRLIVAILISLPFVVYSVFNASNIWSIPAILAVNIFVWQVRAGSLGKVGKYDILIEDICRSTGIAVSITLIM